MDPPPRVLYVADRPGSDDGTRTRLEGHLKELVGNADENADGSRFDHPGTNEAGEQEAGEQEAGERGVGEGEAGEHGATGDGRIPEVNHASVVTVDSIPDGIERLLGERVDCVVAGHDPPHRDGFALLDAVRDVTPDVPIVFFPRTGSEGVAVGAMRRGGVDYVPRQAAEGTPAVERLAERVIEAVTTWRSAPFERLPVGAAVWDDAFELVRTNAEGETLLGSWRVDLRGESLATFVTDGEGDPTDSVRDALVEADGGPIETVERTRTAADETIVCEWTHRGLLDADGDLDAVVSTFRDVSERIERERRVDELRDRLRELAYTTTVDETVDVAVDAATDVMEAPLSGVHLLSEDEEMLSLAGTIEKLDGAFETLPEYERNAPPGTRARFVWDVFESGEPARIDDVGVDDRIEEETPARSVLIHPIGEHGVFIVSARREGSFDDTDDALAEILARTLETAMNRVKREERRRERERRLARLHEATRDLIECETELEVAERAITAAEEILGFSITLVRLYDDERGGLVPVAESNAVADVFPDRTAFTPDDGSLNWQAYESGEVALHDDIEETTALDAGTGLRSLMILPLGAYGTMSVGELDPHAFSDADVSVARILATTVETVLEAHDRKAEIREQRDELEAQNDRLERFADVLSHDLRNPLSVAQGRLKLAQDDCTCDATDHYEAIDDAHDRMSALIDGLLAVAREGDAVTDPETVDLHEILERCWRTVDTGDAELRIRTDATIVANPTRLRQLLENLFRNGVEHGRSNADDGVTITVGDLDGDAGFYVEDDGPGIPDDLRSKIFEFGYTTASGGTGFGLAIVGRIARAHGWDVTVTESATGGARFEFRT